MFAALGWVNPDENKQNLFDRREMSIFSQSEMKLTEVIQNIHEENSLI